MKPKEKIRITQTSKKQLNESDLEQLEINNPSEFATHICYAKKNQPNYYKSIVEPWIKKTTYSSERPLTKNKDESDYFETK